MSEFVVLTYVLLIEMWTEEDFLFFYGVNGERKYFIDL